VGCVHSGNSYVIQHLLQGYGENPEKTDQITLTYTYVYKELHFKFQ